MNKWFIAIKRRGENLLDLSNLSIIPSPEGHYWADPFLADNLLFFEDYDYEKGVLAVGEWDGKELRNVRTILEEEKHLSFPSVINLDGEWYMTPERCLAGQLWIYKATQFPDIWEQFSLVAFGRYDDPILRQIEDGYEVWTSEDGDKLRVFASRSLVGPWNLIRGRDEQYARSAGHFIGDIRPCQDSVPEYGAGIVFKREDTVISRIGQTWYPNLTGTHTFNVSNKFVIIDGRIKI